MRRRVAWLRLAAEPSVACPASDTLRSPAALVTYMTRQTALEIYGKMAAD